MENAEISFRQGDLITLIKEGEGGWWYCKHSKTNVEGWAPSGFLELHVVDVTHGKRIQHSFSILFYSCIRYPKHVLQSETT